MVGNKKASRQKLMLNGINLPSDDFLDWAIQRVDGTLGQRISSMGAGVPPVKQQFVQQQPTLQQQFVQQHRLPVQHSEGSLEAPQHCTASLPTFVTSQAQAQQ